MEGIAVAGLVLLALYGIAQIWIHLVIRILRPKQPASVILLTLQDDVQGAEQQIRYAWYTAKEQKLPLVVCKGELDEQTEAILHTMLDGCGVCVVSSENLVADACTIREKSV